MKSLHYSLVDLPKNVKALTDGETDLIANLSNVSALIMESVDDINWVGFYILKENELVLGPFQGRVACYRIKMGKGVCGTAAFSRETIMVDDVHKFKGHIACDSSTNSELVIPLFKDNELFGVLDMDSQSFARFGDIKELMISTAKAIEKIL